jgi:hypothetical protein
MVERRSGLNKRILIGVALAVLGLVLVAGIAVFVADNDRRVGALNDNRTYAAGRFFVEINGTMVSGVKSVSGCDTFSNVIKEQPATDGVIPKHVGVPKYDPCVIEVTHDMGAEAYNWIRAMLSRNAVTKTVKIIEADYNYKERSRRTLLNATLAEVAFPAVSGDSKDPAAIRLTIAPEVVQTSTSNAGATVQGAVTGPKQKSWLASNFKLTIPGLPATRVSKISSFVATQEVTEGAIGVTRDYQKEPGKLQLGDLLLDVSAVDAGGWDAWFHSFVVQGNNGQTDEKTATLEFLSPNMVDVLLTLSFKGVGIFRAGAPALDSSEKIARKSYSLYAEEVVFSSPAFGAGATASPPPPPPPPAAAATITEATITAIGAARLVDGETFTISDGTNEPTTFEFDLDGAFKGNPVKISKDAPPEEVAAAIAESINSIGEKLELAAKITGEAQIQLVSLKADAEGEEKILEFVDDDSFKVQDKVVERGAGELPAPTELAAVTGGPGEITLSWKETPGALGYLILFTTEPGGEYRELDKAEGTKVTLADLDPGVEHFFVVRALDGTRESANSNEASAVAGG